MKNILSVIGGILLVFSLAYFGFYLKRTINYNWYYKSAVKETIQEEIRPLQIRIIQLECGKSTI